MRDFAIILDEEDDIRVIASKWLTEDKKSMFWPPFKKASDVTDAVIQLRDVGKNWKTYPITKLIKFNGRLLFFNFDITLIRLYYIVELMYLYAFHAQIVIQMQYVNQSNMG